MPLCSRLRPDVRDRQTDRQTSDNIIALCPRLLGAEAYNELESTVNIGVEYIGAQQQQQVCYCSQTVCARYCVKTVSRTHRLAAVTL